jgi:hypothetical protein
VIDASTKWNILSIQNVIDAPLAINHIILVPELLVKLLPKTMIGT